MKTKDSYFISWCSRYYISSILPHRQYLKIFSLKMHKRTPLGGNDWDSAKYLSIPQDVLTALVFPQHTKGGWGSALVHCVQHGKGTHFLLFLPQRNLPIINWRQRKKPTLIFKMLGIKLLFIHFFLLDLSEHHSHWMLSYLLQVG